MFRRIQIRSKLAGVIAVPLVALVGVAGYEVVQADRVADETAEQTGLTAAAVGPGSLVSALQNERNYTAVDLIGMIDAVTLPVESMEAARTATDGAVADLRAFVADQGPAAAAAFADGLRVVEEVLDDARRMTDDFDGVRDLDNDEVADAVFGRYTRAIGALLDGTAGIALRMDDADLRTGVELVDLSTRLYELRAATIRGAIAAVLAGNDSTAARTEVANALHEMDVMMDGIELRARGAYEGVDAGLDDPNIVRQDTLMRAWAAGGDLDVTELLSTVQSAGQTGVQQVRNDSSSRLLALAADIGADADDQRGLVLALGAGTLVLALGLMVVINRSITLPLQSLTEQAEHMATTTLPAAVQQVLDTPLGEDVSIPEPEPIVVKTRDEVRDVAAALNAVQRSALDLAVEQAVLRRNIADSFVNLGRRNQNLLDRQLDFITELEREEADPETLASLFRLDHLATRMRRNAESLLRLAGSEPQRKWTAPVEMGDVVRGALGEVEDYQRVHVRSLDAAAMPGGAGADLAHALAELLENALTYSPPDEPVEVRGRRTPDGYVIAVTDAGMGMSLDELAVANRRLAGEESFTVAPSRYLGHYVAGHLASRLGVRIELQPGAAGGLIARVDVPASLLVELPAWPPQPAPAAALPAATPSMAPPPAAPPTAPAPVPAASAPAHAAPEPAPEPAPSLGTTPGGLVRRVPGAQRPTTEIGPRPEPVAEEPGLSSADDVGSFLSDFSAGIARGIADAGRNPWEDSDD